MLIGLIRIMLFQLKQGILLENKDIIKQWIKVLNKILILFSRYTTSLIIHRRKHSLYGGRKSNFLCLDEYNKFLSKEISTFFFYFGESIGCLHRKYIRFIKQNPPELNHGISARHYKYKCYISTCSKSNIELHQYI